MHFSNDEVLHRLLRRSKRPLPGTHSDASMIDMNKHIASCIAEVIAPNDNVSGR